MNLSFGMDERCIVMAVASLVKRGVRVLDLTLHDSQLSQINDQWSTDDHNNQHLLAKRGPRHTKKTSVSKTAQLFERPGFVVCCREAKGHMLFRQALETLLLKRNDTLHNEREREAAK